MSIYYNTRGFVLKKIDLREADQVFVVYTEDFGRVEVLGRGIRKIKSKIKPGIDLFYLSEIDFVQGKKQKTLTGATAVKKFKNIRSSPEKLDIAHKISNAADNLITDQEQDINIFNLLKEVFDKIDNCKLKIENCPPAARQHLRSCGGQPMWAGKLKIAYYYFVWNILFILGYKSDLYHCASCEEKLRPEKNYFIPKSGIFCAKCANNRQQLEPVDIRISQDIIKILRILEGKNWEILSKLKTEKTYIEELEIFFQDAKVLS